MVGICNLHFEVIRIVTKDSQYHKVKNIIFQGQTIL